MYTHAFKCTENLICFCQKCFELAQHFNRSNYNCLGIWLSFSFKYLLHYRTNLTSSPSGDLKSAIIIFHLSDQVQKKKNKPHQWVSWSFVNPWTSLEPTCCSHKSIWTHRKVFLPYLTFKTFIYSLGVILTLISLHSFSQPLPPPIEFKYKFL